MILKNAEAVDSFEAIYSNVLLRNNNIIIPYLNLGVPKQLFQELDKGWFFLNYSYIILKNVTYLSVFMERERRRYVVIDSDKEEERWCFGGNYLDIDKGIFNDMYVSCKEAYLEVLEGTRFSEQPWGDELLPGSVAELFLNHKLMPPSIRHLSSFE